MPSDGYQARLPDGPVQALAFDVDDPTRIGRIGYVVHDGDGWRHYPYCIGRPFCRIPMQPPDPTYRVWVEYAGDTYYIEVDPLSTVEYLPLLTVVTEVLPTRDTGAQE